MTRWLLIVVQLVLMPLLVAAPAHSENLKPFLMAREITGSLVDVAAKTRQALTAEGFSVVGEYSPYDGAQVLVVTSPALTQAASRSEFGAYGAIQRVAITKAGNAFQVSCTSPAYMAQAYRMAEDLSGVEASLTKALGVMERYGSQTGLSAGDLRKYHYMFGMPYFTDPDLLATHKSHKAALDAVEAGLAAGKGGTRKIYRVDIPGREETIVGVALSGDKAIMEIIDQGSRKHTAHLPYELIVSGGKVYALNARFRIAMNFPDLTMGTFTKIISAPGDIRDALKAASN